MKKIKERSQPLVGLEFLINVCSGGYLFVEKVVGQPLYADEVNHADDADFQEWTLTSPSVGLELVINGCSSWRRKPG